MNMGEVAVIGGGAAGFFAAISCKQHHPECKVTLYESSAKFLAKVRISGGGRCNVTHDCRSVNQLIKHYPRGEKALKKSFSRWSVAETIAWFEARKIKLKTEPDGRMFPESNTSETIVNCLFDEAKRLDVELSLLSPVLSVVPRDGGFELKGRDGSLFRADKVIVATGGSPKREGLKWLEDLGHRIETPVPSLFTFNLPGDPIRELMGLSVGSARVRIEGNKLESTGPLLITHWGMSGPAILKLSAWGARILNECNYRFAARIQWNSELNEEALRELIAAERGSPGLKKVMNKNAFALPKRLWEFLVEKSGINEERVWQELSKKEENRLIESLINDRYEIEGKTTFKEEFVTCGGVSLQDVNMQTLQSRIIPGMYFAGEVLDIDGITGGFNFQAAWSTGYVAGLLDD